MQGVIVQFQYGDDFDAERIAGIAHQARSTFEGMPGLRQKAFTLDEENRRATNVYLWETEAAARGFFTDALVERVTGLVDNG
jgi:putative monooxygenase ydhR